MGAKQRGGVCVGSAPSPCVLAAEQPPPPTGHTLPTPLHRCFGFRLASVSVARLRPEAARESRRRLTSWPLPSVDSSQAVVNKTSAAGVLIGVLTAALLWVVGPFLCSLFTSDAAVLAMAGGQPPSRLTTQPRPNLETIVGWPCPRAALDPLPRSLRSASSDGVAHRRALAAPHHARVCTRRTLVWSKRLPFLCGRDGRLPRCPRRCAPPHRSLSPRLRPHPRGDRGAASLAQPEQLLPTTLSACALTGGLAPRRQLLFTTARSEHTVTTTPPVLKPWPSPRG